MDPTRASLLLRLKDPQDADAWEEFHELYAPLLYRYARSRGLSHEDAEDVRSTCYEALVQQMSRFEYERERGSFKAWLRTLVNRRVVDLLRKRREAQAGSQALRQLEDDQPTPDEVFDQEWKRQHMRRAVERARDMAPETTWQVFRLLVDGATVEEVGARFGLTSNQVYKARSATLKAVRELMSTLYSELAGG